MKLIIPKGYLIIFSKHHISDLRNDLFKKLKNKIYTVSDSNSQIHFRNKIIFKGLFTRFSLNRRKVDTYVANK